MEPNQEEMRLEIKRFYTETRKIKKDNREIVEVKDDMVEYGQIGMTNRATVIATVKSILNVIDDDDSSNPAIRIASARKRFIEPRYKQWKEGVELASYGTPLNAWPDLNTDHARLLSAKGIRSIEDLAALTEAQIQNVGFMGARDVVQKAQAFLRTRKETNRDAEIAELKARIAVLTQKDNFGEGDGDGAKRKRGRPAKEPTDVEFAALGYGLDEALHEEVA